MFHSTQSLPDEAEIRYHLKVAQQQTGAAEAAWQTLDRALSGTAPAEIRQEAERLRESL